MKNSSKVNIIFALIFGFTTWSFYHTEPMEKKADSEQINAIKLCNQKATAKNVLNRLQFDKQAHFHRLLLHKRQELNLDQGF